VADRDFDAAFARSLGQAFGTLIAESGKKLVSVGRDCRLTSDKYAAALAEGIRSTGVSVVDIGMCPTPLMYFSLFHWDLDGGIQVTGSHNPPEYNGFKMLLNGRSVFGEEIQKLGRRAADGEWSEGHGSVEQVDILDAYVNRLVQDFQGGDFRVGWDAGNGAGGPALEKLVAKLPGEHHAIHTRIDGTFPSHHPDPTVEANLADLKALVVQKGLDFGIAFDGDADRIGAVDAKGRVVWGDQLLMILAEPVLKEQPGATIIADVKASQILFDHVAKIGGTPLMWKTGHSLIKSKMKETGAPLAGEMSGHIFFKHRWYGFDDALYAAVRLIEAVAQSGKSLTEIMDEMPTSTATPEMRFPVDESRKFAVVAEVLHRLSSNGARVDSTDGARVMTDDGWWLLRASNTQDVLVARAEAGDEDGLNRLMAQIDEQLALSGVERTEGVGH